MHWADKLSSDYLTHIFAYYGIAGTNLMKATKMLMCVSIHRIYDSNKIRLYIEHNVIIIQYI